MGESAAASSLSVGTMLAETYRVTRLLGRGGMGAVWEAEHARLPGKRVAVKVLHAEVAADEESLARFRREAEIASRLGHPNIVDVHDFNILPSGTPYLVLEYLEGEDLAARLTRGAMDLDEVASIVRQIGSGLQAAHAQNIVHRDLKPQNVFLVPTEAGGFVTLQAKLLDFGISKIRGSQTVKTNASDMLGTPQYMAPEQATGQHDAVDGRTDVFALGAMVYEMLAGSPAFPGQSIPEVVFKVVYEDPKPLGELVQVPPGVADAVHQALAKKQEERFDDISSFVEALTGSPLNTLQKGAIIARPDGASAGAPTGGPVHTGEAMAATIDSGRAGVDAALAGTVASSKTPIESDTNRDALAATVDSSKAGVAVPLPTEVSPLANTAAAPAPASRKGLWLGLGFVAVAGAAVALTLALTGGGTSNPEVAAADPSAITGAADATTAPRLATEGDETPAEPEAPSELEKAVNEVVDDAKDGVTKAVEDIAKSLPGPAKHEPREGELRKEPPRKEPPRKEPPRKEPPKASAVPAEIRAQLVKAEGLLRAGRGRRALVAARRTVFSHPTDQGRSIMARAYCQMNDFGMAVSTLRMVKNRRVRRKIVRYCKQQGHDLSP